jgi:ferredoxin
MDQTDSATAHFSLQRQERSRGGESRSFFSSHPPSCCFAAVVLPEWSTGASAWPIFFCGTCAAICPPRVEHWGLCMAYPFLLTLVQQFVPPEWSIGASGRPVFFCGTCAAVFPPRVGNWGLLHGPSSSAALVQQFCPPRVERSGLCMAHPLLLALVQQFVLPSGASGPLHGPPSSTGTRAAVLSSPSGALRPLHGPSSSACT